MGLYRVQWKDMKDVMPLSNCHSDKVVTANRKQKDGKKFQLPAQKLSTTAITI